MSTTHHPRPSRRRGQRVLLLAAVLVLLATGCNVRAMGSNRRAQLGDGTQVDRSTPTEVVGAVTFTSVSAGAAHSCGISRTGALYCWGTGAQLGLGDGLARAEPTRVGTASDWTAISAGFAHSCGIRQGGRVFCWGINGDGQAVPRGADTIDVPTIAAPETERDTATSVAAGERHTCATFTSGTLACWGFNGDGRLGIGQASANRLPVLVTGEWRTVAAGRHSCAIDTTARLHCWGPNGKGQLGGGDLEASMAPRPVIQQPGWASVDVGAFHTCGRATDGTAWCWGEGERGALGTGTVQDRLVPVRVAGATRWIAIDTGTLFTCGVRTDHQVACWGHNGSGQLGGTFGDQRLLPTLVPGAADLDAVGVTAGGDHTHIVLASE